MIPEDLLRPLVTAWRNALGEPWPSWKLCDDVILFGSRVLPECPMTSDWDVLCIGGESDRRRREGLDVVVIGSDLMTEQRWLESELASHVLAYGLWIRGRGLWRPAVRISDFTVSEKRRRIAHRVGVLDRKWQLFDERFRTRHLRLLRRDMQRLLLLLDRRPVPPSTVLDEMWATGDAKALLKDAEGALPGDLAAAAKRWLRKVDMGRRVPAKRRVRAKR